MLGQLIEHGGEWTVVDMEASVEHMSRGTVRHVDALFMVAEPYYRALETVGRIAPLAADLGIPRRLVVANKLRSGDDAAAIRKYCEDRGLEIAAELPFDEQVLAADRAGRPVIDAAATSEYVRIASGLAARLTNASHPRGERA